jgi:ketosteroid isomerase-like protein
MTQRHEIEKLLGELYAARVEGQLDRLCALFAGSANFKIAGASEGKPIVLAALGSKEIRAWLAVMLKTFKLSQYQQIMVVIEDTRAAVHWRADIHSKITGVIVPTELVDLVEVIDGRITSYREFFAPC